MKHNSQSEKAAGSKQVTQKDNHSSASPLEFFFISQLQDMYGAENKLLDTLNEIAGYCTSEELEDAVMDHRKQTERQVKRIEKIFSMVGREATEKKCAVMEALVAEAKEIIEMTPEDSATRDAAIIIALQKTAHYEIATYGGLLELALTMELGQAAALLDKTLKEEEEADRELTYIAESFINVRAEQEGPYSWQKNEEVSV
ncbi:MAG: DUF892 family protein [Sphingobacteriales bacterium]|nr:DUF892 family protein [Sphingobacteriales bacterium]OJW35053.1 MAG: hypothetical protein BGO54_02565 [Sphingobacteriales bacterium 46-32]